MIKKLKTIICIIICLNILTVVPCNVVAEQNTLQSKVIVSMGDSFSSGEGIPPFYGQCDNPLDSMKNQDWLAHRSKESWPGQLKLPAVSKEKSMSEFRDKNWYFVATSGAETKHINNTFYKKYSRDGVTKSLPVDPQIKVFNQLGDKKADYVTLTLGGNDAKFADIVGTASIKNCLFDTNALVNELNKIWYSFYKEDGIRDDLRRAYSDIYYVAGPQAKIIVAGYPKLLCDDGGLLFTKDAAALLNESVSRFNDEIETLVNSCKAEGMKICFVSVENEFAGREAYAKDTYMKRVYFGPEPQDLEEDIPYSRYSIHPNEEGAKAYARCVQRKIDEIEADGGASEWPSLVGSKERDAALVLDVSGSMAGTPLEETKQAATRFTNTVLHEDVGVGIVVYDNDAMKLSDFNKNSAYLQKTIENLISGGGTDIESGLIMAEQMFDEDSSAKQKFIVLMSDGEPNEGKCGEELIQYAKELKDKGIRIYTLGFFSGLSSKVEAQRLMEQIASEGCHFEVDDAEKLMFFFDDIAEQIKGTKYYYIRIACPVDVTVKYNGEILSSEGATETQRTEFGTLTFEENPEESDESEDNRIKILRLKEGVNYDVHIEGNGRGKMTYTIGFMDEENEYSDLREFKNIKIRKNTEIDTVAVNARTTTMKVDEDGDGKYDYIYRAEESGDGELIDYKNIIYILIAPIILFILLIVISVAIIIIKRKRRKAENSNTYTADKFNKTDGGNSANNPEALHSVGGNIDVNSMPTSEDSGEVSKNDNEGDGSEYFHNPDMDL